MESRTEVILTAWVGIVGFALTMVGGLMAGEFDSAGATPSDIADLYESSSFDAQFVTGVILETLGFLLLMAFVAGLAHALYDSKHGAGWLGRVIVALVIVATVLTLVSVFSHGAATFRAANGGLVGDGYVVLYDIRHTAYWVSLPAWGLILLAGGTLIVRMRSFTLLIGWAALPIGVALLVVPFIDNVDVWDAATGLAVLWFMATAVYMLVRPDRYSSPRAETSALV
jgi:hypothetical protein